MSKKTWIIFTAIVIAVLGLLIFLSRSNRLDVSNVENNSIIAASEQNGNIGDHTFGNNDSKVILIEYSDFQCPGCASAQPYVKSLVDKYQNDIVFVARNYPIVSSHPNAKAAAATAEAAGLQGKYWEMFNKLFEAQNVWSRVSATERTGIFESYARDLDLDIERFNNDIASQEVSQKISFDLALGKANAVDATPTFFLSGRKLSSDEANKIIQGNTADLESEIKKLLEQTQNTDS